MFVSTFHAIKLTTQAWKMPNLADFIESLSQEQDKLVMMGTIKPSKDQPLLIGDLKVDSKGKKKSNSKKPLQQKRDNSKYQEDSSCSKKKFQKKNNKGEMSKFAYCSKGYHPESYCMKKKIHTLTQVLENTISLPECTNKREG